MIMKLVTGDSDLLALLLDVSGEPQHMVVQSTSQSGNGETDQIWTSSNTGKVMKGNRQDKKVNGLRKH